MWILTGLSATVLFVVTVTRGVRFSRDWFFLLLLVQAFAYLHVGPTLAATSLASSRQVLYVWLQLAALVLFEIPFVLLYLYRVKKCTVKQRPELRIMPRKLFLLSMALFAGSGAFVFVLIRNGLVFYRIGAAIAAKLVDLSTIDWILYRGYLISCPLVMAVLLIAVLQMRRSLTRKIAGVSLILLLGIYFGHAMINSRGTFLLIALFLLGVVMVWMRRGRLLKRSTLVFGLISVLTLCFGAWTISSNIRLTAWSSGFPLQYLNPVTAYGSDAGIRLAWRLNGIDLMARITPQAIEEGFAFGAAWRIPAYVAIAQLFSRSSVNAYKLSYMTTAKSYLMRHYTDDLQGQTDYYSSVLTDAYGNFWVLGFPLVAWVLAIACAYGTKFLATPRSPTFLLVGLFVLLNIFTFERPFIDIVVGWIKLLPILLVFLLVNPIRILRAPRNALLRDSDATSNGEVEANGTIALN